LFVIEEDQLDFITEVVSHLGVIHSPAYPRGIFIFGAAPHELPGVDVLRISDERDLAGQVTAYVRSTLAFNKSGLLVENKAALPRAVDVVIVGGGITALYAAHRMSDRRISFCIAEKDEIVGGIWAKYANATSQVNTSEGAYRLFDHDLRANKDHSSTAEMLGDIKRLTEEARDGIFTSTKVERIEKNDNGYVTTVSRGSETSKISSKGVLLAVNDRVGAPREVTWHNQERYQGILVDGYSDETAGMDWAGKKVTVIGMGAFAVENARTALEAGAAHVTVVCRRHGTVCPKIIDYLNFSTPYDENFEHERKSNIRNMMLWKKLYDLSGAEEPECWMGKIKHTGHTISVSDIWFIAHHLKKMETVTGSVGEMYEGGVIVEGKKIDADIVVTCVGFHRNASTAKALCGYEEMYNVNYIDKDFMYLADAFIDDNAFNSFFGSSVLEMTRFYMDVFLEYFDTGNFEEMTRIAGIEKMDIEERSWSHYITGAMALIHENPRFADAARVQVDERTARFLESHDLETYIAENKREWYDTHTLLAGGPLPEGQCLPYVFERLAEKKLG
ncbi:MAG: FAD-dependent oxidoreductase, partial [Spirochaetales bacterium]|nr:FAD-dependent oxidoreductase [Spirochaetales bacterium]